MAYNWRYRVPLLSDSPLIPTVCEDIISVPTHSPEVRDSWSRCNQEFKNGLCCVIDAVKRNIPQRQIRNMVLGL